MKSFRKKIFLVMSTLLIGDAGYSRELPEEQAPAVIDPAPAEAVEGVAAQQQTVYTAAGTGNIQLMNELRNQIAEDERAIVDNELLLVAVESRRVQCAQYILENYE